MPEMDTNSTKKWVEIKIPMTWGHISAKWWGPRDVRPILGMHGWQDNAGTFDTLAPLLPKHVGLLAIDFPGQGLSSRLPNGIFYHSVDNVLVLLTIMKAYNWDKISILGHSTGSIIGFMFTGLFPEKVESFIGIDALKPHIRPLKSIPKTIAKRYKTFLIADDRNQSNEDPPCYSYEECIEKFHLGTVMSVDLDKCKYIVDRCIAESTKYPGKYYFTRDSRLKSYSYGTFSQEVCLEIAKRIESPYLFIKATKSTYFEEQRFFDETIEILKKNPNFHLVHVGGTHHVHLNDPQQVIGIICEFYNKYGKIENVQKGKL